MTSFVFTNMTSLLFRQSRKRNSETRARKLVLVFTKCNYNYGWHPRDKFTSGSFLIFVCMCVGRISRGTNTYIVHCIRYTVYAHRVTMHEDDYKYSIHEIRVGPVKWFLTFILLIVYYIVAYISCCNYYIAYL